MKIIRDHQLIESICDDFGFIFLATMVVVNDTEDLDSIELDFVFEYDDDEFPLEVLTRRTSAQYLANIS